MQSPIVLFDVWEGSQEVNEVTLKANNISGLVIRINDMNGGHHLDETFFQQFSESVNAGLITGIYFVYNPWVSGQTNYNWLSANIPTVCKSVCVDIEVPYNAVSTTQYATEVRKFIDLCKSRWNTMIYTGEWFLQYLAYWPTDVPYWWAQYPLSMYPENTEYWTYDKMYATMLPLTIPSNATKIPGRLLMWQCSGDRIILPGTQRSNDINIFYGNQEELIEWFGTPSQPPIIIGDNLIKSESWSEGCDYEQWDVTTNHGVVHTHLITIDNDDIDEIFISPRPTSPHYVPTWMEQFPTMDIAINCDQFVGVTMGGLNISHGIPYGPQNTEASVFIDHNNNLTLKLPPISLGGTLWNGYGIPNILAQNGATLAHIKAINALKGHRPRTATAKSREGSKFYILIVDGDETYNINTESGFDFIETSEFILRHGGWEVYMSDGGGSATLCRRLNGNIKVINAARGEDYVAKYNAYLRRVANVLCVKMKTQITPPIPQTLTGTLTVTGKKISTFTLEKGE